MTTLLEQPSRKIETRIAPSIEELILIRMAIPAKQPPAPKKIRDEVGALLGRTIAEQEYIDLAEELLQQGLLSKGRGKARIITEAGRARALAALELAEFPAKSNWQSVIATCWMPPATGRDAAQLAKLKSKDQLAAFLLKRRYGLNDNVGNTTKQVTEALVCQQLGYPQLVTLVELAEHVLGTLMGNDGLTFKQIQAQLPVFKTGLKSSSSKVIRELLVREWLLGKHESASASERVEQTPPQQEAFDLPAFVATVRRFARDAEPAARFHDDKVFVAALWHALQREPKLPRLSLPEFKQHLLAANNAGLLQLRRADLVQVMDPQLVKDSEIQYLNAVFHFVLID